MELPEEIQLKLFGRAKIDPKKWKLLLEPETLTPSEIPQSTFYGESQLQQFGTPPHFITPKSAIDFEAEYLCTFTKRKTPI